MICYNSSPSPKKYLCTTQYYSQFNTINDNPVGAVILFFLSFFLLICLETTLVKIFVRSLKILEDLHEDPSADL